MDWSVTLGLKSEREKESLNVGGTAYDCTDDSVAVSRGSKAWWDGTATIRYMLVARMSNTLRRSRAALVRGRQHGRET